MEEWSNRTRELLEQRFIKAKNEKQVLKNRLREYSKDNERHLCYFGCGVQGKAIYHILKKEDIIPDFFCDNNVELAGKEIIDDIRCISVSQLCTLKNVIVLLTVGLGSANLIYDQLTGIVKKEEISIIKFPLDSLGLAYDDLFDFPEQTVLRNMEQLYDVLQDDISKKIAYTKLFCMLVSLEEMNHFSYKDIYSEPQYYPDDVIQLNREEVIVEGGSYIGDSLQYFIEEMGMKDFKKYFCYELDEENYKILSHYVDSLEAGLREKVVLKNCGISDKTCTMAYSSIGEASNILEKEADGQEVKIVALDDDLKDERVTFIKMDIEGSEIDALYGAQKIICAQIPRLAICVYHKARHLWEVPMLIHKLNPQYKLYLRHHTLITTDTVCYAV